MEETNFSILKDGGTLNLITYYKSGGAVPTLLEYVKSGEMIYVNTRLESFKIK